MLRMGVGRGSDVVMMTSERLRRQRGVLVNGKIRKIGQAQRQGLFKVMDDSAIKGA